MKSHFRKPWRAALLTLAACMFAFPLAAAVQLEVDRQRVTEGETVTLTIFTDDPRQSLEADFSPLESDFAILDRRSETQLSIVNGKQTALVRLVLTVEPKRTGTLTVPELAFGAHRTAPVTLQVEPAPQLAPGELPPVFIEVEVTPGQGPYYVHAQLGLVVRVFYQQNLTEAAISQPEPTPASVRLLQETPYQAERGGERYRVLERRYAIFPERSGELEVPALQLSGRLVERRASGIWQPNVRGRRITVESEALRLTIEPRPAGFTGDAWQPARELSLAQQISAGDSLSVGEPVTRTVIIDAVGLEDNMIAEPAWPEIADARIYPDQPQGISRDDGEWVLGHKEFRYAVVPEQAGQLVLPELRVDWWDVVNDQPRTAVLPARVLEVRPSALAAPPPTEVMSDPVRDAAAAGARIADGDAGVWRWLTVLFAALWLLTLGFAGVAWRGRGRPRARARAGAAADRDESALLAALRSACQSGDAAEARRHLAAWLRARGPGPGVSLLDFAARGGDARLRAAIYDLDAEGFRREGGAPWQGGELWEAFDGWRRSWLAAGRQQHAAPTDLYDPANRVA